MVSRVFSIFYRCFNLDGPDNGLCPRWISFKSLGTVFSEDSSGMRIKFGPKVSPRNCHRRSTPGFPDSTRCCLKILPVVLKILFGCFLERIFEDPLRDSLRDSSEWNFDARGPSG